MLASRTLNIAVILAFPFWLVICYNHHNHWLGKKISQVKNFLIGARKNCLKHSFVARQLLMQTYAVSSVKYCGCVKKTTNIRYVLSVGVNTALNKSVRVEILQLC